MYFGNGSRSASLLALACILAFSALLSTQTVSADSLRDEGVYGYWKSIDKDTGKTQSIFKLYEHDGKLAGKIVKVFPKPGEEYDPICHKCDGYRKDKPKIGMVFFWGFVPSKDKPRKWVDGKILNPDNGKTYGSEVTLSEDGKSLSVYGYIRILFKIGGTSVWKRPTSTELKGV